MKKVLFIDRDGTLVIEPPIDKQLDSLEKLEYYPGVFRYLSLIATELDYELVIVTNQDGLGTASFPEATFWPAHNKMLQAFANEGVRFRDILIDRSLPAEKAATRKPGTAMLGKYLTGNYDLAASFVIGDRATDIQLATNIGAKGIYLSSEADNNAVLTTTSWQDIYTFLCKVSRTSKLVRNTNETSITVEVNLDGRGDHSITTGIGFFDHMLQQVAKHSGMDIYIAVQGDLYVDEHHTIEDTGIALGNTIRNALGKKIGIERYGFILPMDDSLAQVAIDFSSRPWLVWDAAFSREMIGDMPTEMLPHFFRSFSDGAACNLNIQLQGDNEHHKAEAAFKGLARALRMAIKQNGERTIPTTKGIL